MPAQKARFTCVGRQVNLKASGEHEMIKTRRIRVEDIPRIIAIYESIRKKRVNLKRHFDS